jgi:hypothetical protein
MKLSSPLVVTPSVRYEVQHVVGVLLSAFVGAVIAFLLTQQSSIPAALTDWSHAKPLLLGALAMGIVATLTQAQKSYFTSAAAVAMIVVFGISTTTACTPAQNAVLNQIDQDVLADLKAGKGADVIASDVCRDLGGSALTDAICAKAVVIAEDVVTYLIDAAVVPPAALQHTTEVVRPGLAAMRRDPALKQAP